MQSVLRAFRTNFSAKQAFGLGFPAIALFSSGSYNVVIVGNLTIIFKSPHKYDDPCGQQISEVHYVSYQDLEQDFFRGTGHL